MIKITLRNQKSLQKNHILTFYVIVIISIYLRQKLNNNDLNNNNYIRLLELELIKQMV